MESSIQFPISIIFLFMKIVHSSQNRYVMRAASQLPGKGPTNVDDAPASAR